MAVVVLVTIACSIGPQILNSNAQSFSLFIKNKYHRGLGRFLGDGTELQKVGTSQTSWFSFFSDVLRLQFPH